jgi:hypothetical protein
MLFTRERVVEAARRETSSNAALRKTASAKRMLEAALKAAATDQFDIFLSHARVDADVVYGARLELEQYGFTVYVDWIEDPALDRSKVDAQTARTLRSRMKQCHGLLYVHTDNSTASKWMPWELGYFDGYAEKSAVLPISERVEEQFKGTEYVGIYPYVTDETTTEGKSLLWVIDPEDASKYTSLRGWLSGKATIRKHT